MTRTSFAGIALPHAKSGKLRALAVTSARRTPLLPDMPTVAEAGVKERYASHGLEATSNTPKPFAAHIKSESASFAKIIKDSGVKVD